MFKDYYKLIDILWLYNGLSTTNGYAQIYDYDDLLRPESVTDSIGSQELTTEYTYDENGRVSEVTYPGGFGVTYTYQNGALKEIHRSDNDDLIWQLNDITAKGEITSVTYGNGLSTNKTYNNKGQLLSIQTGYNDSIQDLEYSYNSNGTMQWRKDHRHSSITENFIYDNLKRLTASIVGTDTISIEYASNGNIESKSDLGDYAYSTIHPNAVINVSGSDSIDLNEEDISYTSFNKIDSLTQGDNSISFLYGSDYSRKKSVINVNNVETVKFYSGIYEKSITFRERQRDGGN